MFQKGFRLGSTSPLRIQSEYRKIRTRNNSVFGHFSRSVFIEPTHILERTFSCVYLIFTSQPKLVMESGVHTSLHQICHH